jgi:hypothetical protein
MNNIVIGLSIVLAAFNIITLLILLQSPNAFNHINQHIQTESQKSIDTSVPIKAIKDRVHLGRLENSGSNLDTTYYMESRVDRLGKFCETTCSISILNFSEKSLVTLPAPASVEVWRQPVAGVWTTTEGIYNLSVTFDNEVCADGCDAIKITLDYNYIGNSNDTEKYITLNGRFIYPLSETISQFVQLVEQDT